MRRNATLLFSSLLLLAGQPAWAGPHSDDDDPELHHHHPLRLRLGIGGGFASIQPESTDSLDHSLVAALVHVGWQLTPAWRIGMDVHGGTFAFENDWLSVNHISLGTVSFFPVPKIGAYIKVGVGLGYLNLTAARTTVAFDILGALGYELQLTERWSIGIEVWCGFTRYPDGLEVDGSAAALLGYQI